MDTLFLNASRTSSPETKEVGYRELLGNSLLSCFVLNRRRPISFTAAQILRESGIRSDRSESGAELYTEKDRFPIEAVFYRKVI